MLGTLGSHRFRFSSTTMRASKITMPRNALRPARFDSFFSMFAPPSDLVRDSSKRPVGLKTSTRISRAKVKASEKTDTSHAEGRPLMIFSQMPMMRAPMTAPGMLPMPPNTAATKAFRPGSAPTVGTTAW